MKKLISLLLSAALCVCLSACGESTDTNRSESTANTTASSTETTESTESTTATTEKTESEEEKALKARYDDAIAKLEQYLEDGYVFDKDWNLLTDNAASEYLYKEFDALGDYEDSAEILARFTVFFDRLMSITNTRTDHLGNAEEYTYKSYEYDEKGTSSGDPILELLGVENYWYSFQYEYDEMDRIAIVKLVEYDTVEAIITPEYDANGNIVKSTMQTNEFTSTSTYSYDEQNRLISAEHYRWLNPWYLCPCSHTYSYDASGKLTQESYLDANNYEGITEYEYDANGYLVTEKKTYTEYPGEFAQIQTIYRYTNDENGKPISAELTETFDGRNSYASQILTYNYETLYVYNAE